MIKRARNIKRTFLTRWETGSGWNPKLIFIDPKKYLSVHSFLVIFKYDGPLPLKKCIDHILNNKLFPASITHMRYRWIRFLFNKSKQDENQDLNLDAQHTTEIFFQLVHSRYSKHGPLPMPHLDSTWFIFNVNCKRSDNGKRKSFGLSGYYFTKERPVMNGLCSRSMTGSDYY